MEDDIESVSDETTASGPGALLRAAREEKGLELEQVAAETRVPLRHLAAIEEGRYDSMPSRTYAIGFSRTYAQMVGLDEDEIVDQVRAELGDADYNRTVMAGGMEPGDPAKLPSSGLAWFGGIAALILAVGAIAFFSTYYGSGADPASLLAGNDEAEATEGADSDSDAQVSNDAPSASGQVVITAMEDDIWVRFFEQDGERLLEKVMEKGETFEVPKTASDPRVNTGLPHLLAITIDGQSVPKLSEEQVVLADAEISAEALLARSDASESAE